MQIHTAYMHTSYVHIMRTPYTHTTYIPHTHPHTVQNNADEHYTVVVIKPPQQEPTALLNVASVLTGIGLSIHKGQIVSEVCIKVFV